MKRKGIIFFGPPGAGKGTEAKLVADNFDFAHISTGDMLRAEAKSGSELGKMVSGLIDNGTLVPDDLMIEMVEKRLSQDDCTRGFILDGFPRTLSQAKALDKVAKINLVFEISVSDDEVVERISKRRNCKDKAHVFSIYDVVDGKCPICGSEIYQRADDTEATVHKRLDVYKEQSAPLIDYYSNKNILVAIDGNRTREEVYQDICESLEKHER